jgi:hypothetical protein
MRKVAAISVRENARAWTKDSDAALIDAGGLGFPELLHLLSLFWLQDGRLRSEQTTGTAAVSEETGSLLELSLREAECLPL